ncbi:hypothetical protein AWC03_03480 [Mycobacterium europaeum]|nr:hemophore-related protein [Mycobacterium europaeum]ORV65009.1 hypothetical protein AWC03_03480 [Mycobacterium europaeum]
MPKTVAGGVATVVVCSAMIFSIAGLAMADPSDPEPAPPPNCTQADFFQVSAGVAAATSRYLFAHPAANAKFTGVSDVRDQLQQYKSANPEAQADLAGIRQPLTEFLNRCQRQ